MTRLQLETQQEREWQAFEREHTRKSPKTGDEFVRPASLREAYELGLRHGREMAEFRAAAAEEWEAQWK